MTSAISGTTGTAAQNSLTSAVNSTASSQQQFATNMNSFLTLLTTQLKYQDPTSPMDTAQFTNQLVEFAGVQQEIDVNQNLESMLANQDNTSMATAANYVGKQATGVSSSLPLQNSAAQFAYTVPAGTASVSVVITDNAGNIVDTMSGNSAAGTNISTWDGKNILGTTQADGTYNLTVNAVSTSGTNTQLQTAVTGTVTGVGTDPTTNQTELFMGGTAVDLSTIVEVQAAGSSIDTGQVGTALGNAAAAAAGTSNTNTGG